MNFQLDEVVDIVADYSGRYPELVGLECTIVGLYTFHITLQGEVWGWTGELHDGRQYIFVPGELRRKRRPGDCDEVTTWGADVLGAPSPWQPKKETVK